MNDKISQIQAKYDAIEDRILLTLKTENHSIFSAFITRKYAKLLLPILHGKHPQSGEPLLPAHLNEEHQNTQMIAQATANVEESFQPPESPNYPLGQTPILLAQVTFQNLDTEQGKFILEPEKGPGLVLPFKAELLGPLLHIFEDAIQRADWGLESHVTLATTSNQSAVIH
jgi:hypothetical protein